MARSCHKRKISANLAVFSKYAQQNNCNESQGKMFRKEKNDNVCRLVQFILSTKSLPPCLYWATEKRPISRFNGPEYQIISIDWN